MKKENKVRIFNRLFFKLYLNYAVMIAITAVLIGFIFMQQYENKTIENNKEQLLDQAEIISNYATESIINGNQDDFLMDIDIFQRINNWDSWTISNPEAQNPMGSKMETGDPYDEFIASEEYAQYVQFLKGSFNGYTMYDDSFDDLYGTIVITISEPIYEKVDGKGEVVGVVIVKQSLDDIKTLQSQSLSVIIFSIVVALGISFVIVIVFATKLSLPISRMRATALELAEGNYNSKTGIRRNDEIGDLACTVDILSEKLLENDIERKKLDQMRFDFFANVSHELRTPITVIRAYTETLADGVVQDEERVGQYYNRMLSECKSMERLVADLLILSKMQNPDFAIEREPVNLQQVFDDIIRSAGAIAEKKNISIEVIKEEPCSMILGDYDRLRQMFMVILDNAIKFSDENKTVHIKLMNEDTIKVSIRDEGIGIEASDIGNIFEKFYKSNLRQNASGTGLGLAIAKQIAMKHDGIIEVESTPGVGTVFIFVFPPFLMEDL